MAKRKRYPLGAFLKQFSTEAQCQKYIASMRWKEGYVCFKCGCRHACQLSNGRYQCAQCHHQVSVTAGTVLHIHKTRMPLTQWFLAFYLVCQDKRGISAVQLSSQLGTTYKTAWYMLKRIRSAMGQRDEKHQLSGIIPERIRQSALSQDDGHAKHQAGIRQKICPIRICRGQHSPQ